MTNESSSTPVIKILIVDDMLTIRRLVRELLKPLGAQITEAENGQDAINEILQTEYDVILMDIEMPAMNGFSVMRQLRTVHGFKYLPVIVMTGLEDELLVKKAFEVGAYDYVRKPIHAEELMARVRAVIERKRLDRSMYYARKQAESANTAKSEFITHLTHELNTPLNAISGYAQLLNMSEGLSEIQKDYLQQIHKAVKLQQHLIRDSLELAKIEAGLLSIDIQELNLYESLKEAFSMIQPIASKHGIHVHKPKKNEASILIEADKKRLLQVLLNLIGNAIKYNRPDGSVDISVQPLTRDRVRLGIHDTGIGIAEHKMPQLFQSFNRLGAESSTIEGYGLGLSLTKQMIETMNGTINVESVEGVGSTFWVELSKAVH